MTDNPLTKEEIAGLERFAEHNTSQNYITAVAIDPRMLSRLLAMLKDKDAAVERARVEEREACALVADSKALGEHGLFGIKNGTWAVHDGACIEIAAAIRSRTANAVASATSASPSTCFECDTPLIGPLCPRCNPASPSLRDAALEEAAKIVEGQVVAERYREWPQWGTGDRSTDSEAVKLTTVLAAAIRALKSDPSP